MAVAHVDSGVIVTILALLLIPVLGAFIGQQLGKIEANGTQVIQQTNGNLSRMLDVLERQGQMLAASSSPAAVAQVTAAAIPLIEERHTS